MARCTIGVGISVWRIGIYLFEVYRPTLFFQCIDSFILIGLFWDPNYESVPGGTKLIMVALLGNAKCTISSLQQDVLYPSKYL